MATKKFSNTTAEDIALDTKILSESNSTTDKFAHITGQKIKDFIISLGYLTQTQIETLIDNLDYMTETEIHNYVTGLGYLTESEILALDSLIKSSQFNTDSVLTKNASGDMTSVKIKDLETAYPKLLWKGFLIDVGTTGIKVGDGRYYNENLFTSTLNKTWDAYVFGTGNGCLDSSSLEVRTKYYVNLIEDAQDPDYKDIYVSTGKSAPSGYILIKTIGVFYTGETDEFPKTIQLDEYLDNTLHEYSFQDDYKSQYTIGLKSPTALLITNCHTKDDTNIYNQRLYGTSGVTLTLSADTQYYLFQTSNKGDNVMIEQDTSIDGTGLTNPHKRLIGAFKTNASSEIEAINIINLANNFREAVIGDFANNDYTHIYPDGTVRYRGKATVWDDIAGNLIARRLESTTGTLQYDFDENAIEMQSGGSISNTADRLIFNYPKYHGIKKESVVKLHIHWWQETTNKIVFTVQYRIQPVLGAKETSWTTITANSDDDAVGTYAAGDNNQIVEFEDIDWSDFEISSTLQIRLARTDSTSGSIRATFVDAHAEWDANGSEEEYKKIIP